MLDWINFQIDSWLQPQILLPSDIESLPSDAYIPKISDIIVPSIVVAVTLVVIRHLFDRCVITPIGVYFEIGEKANKTKTSPSPILEHEYANCEKPTEDKITIISKKTGLTERQVSAWFRKRNKQNKTSDLKRLQDASWHFIFYIIMSWYGIYVLWDKPWFEKAKHCWTDWPMQSVSSGIYWYYLIEFGFYLSGVYMLFTDHKRKDFTELIIHHAVTLFLMLISFTYNLVRVGSLILCVHDPVDYILAMAKIAIYGKKHMLADMLFVAFVLVWIATRLCIYPFVILYSVFVDIPNIATDSNPQAKKANESSIMFCVKASLLILQILHLIWTFLIIKSAAAKFTKGKIEDARSDCEDSENELEHDVGKERNGNLISAKSKSEHSCNGNGTSTHNGYLNQGEVNNGKHKRSLTPDDVNNLSLPSH